LAAPGKAGSNGKDGKDGSGFTIRGTYDPECTKGTPGVYVYQQNDVVTLNRTWFAAKHANPGPCPGPGWQAGPAGLKGEKGERGHKGEQGLRGETGANGREFVGWNVDARKMTAVPVMDDGELGPELNLRGLFEEVMRGMESR
jgi:hypothetical protein